MTGTTSIRQDHDIAPEAQKIVVFQQNGGAESKVAGIIKFGNGFFDLDIVSINQGLPPVIDDASEYLPDELYASVVLDYLKHPDLSYDLALMCRDKKIPVVASGKKIKVDGVICPPT